MRVKRNSNGVIKKIYRGSKRDFHHAHLKGAIRLVKTGKRTVDSFSEHMRNAINANIK